MSPDYTASLLPFPWNRDANSGWSAKRHRSATALQCPAGCYCACRPASHPIIRWLAAVRCFDAHQSSGPCQSQARRCVQRPPLHKSRAAILNRMATRKGASPGFFSLLLLFLASIQCCINWSPHSTYDRACGCPHPRDAELVYTTGLCPPRPPHLQFLVSLISGNATYEELRGGEVGKFQKVMIWIGHCQSQGIVAGLYL